MQSATAEYTWTIIIIESALARKLRPRAQSSKQGLARGHPAPQGGALRPNPDSAPPSLGASAHPPPPPLPPGQTSCPARVCAGCWERLEARGKGKSVILSFHYSFITFYFTVFILFCFVFFILFSTPFQFYIKTLIRIFSSYRTLLSFRGKWSRI